MTDQQEMPIAPRTEAPSGNDELELRLKEMIIEELDLADFTPADIADDAPLFGDEFGLDSIDAVEIVFQIKTRFGVEIRDMKEGRPALENIRTLAAFIRRYQS